MSTYHKKSVYKINLAETSVAKVKDFLILMGREMYIAIHIKFNKIFVSY